MRVRGYAQPYNLDHRAPNMAHYSERVPVVIVDEYEDIARLIADRIATLIRTKRAAGEHAVLGLATGSTPIGIYRELIRLHREEGLDFSNVITFNLDEYYPDAAGQHPQLPPVHAGELLRPRRTSSRRTCTSRAATSRAARSSDYCREYEAAIDARRRHRLPDPRHRPDRPHRVQRAGLGARFPHPPGHAGHDHAHATPPPTSSARRTCRARRSPWASPRSSRRARSRSSPPASTRRPSSAAPSRARSSTRTSPPRYLQRASQRHVLPGQLPRPRAHAHQARPGWSARSSGRRSSIDRAVIWLAEDDQDAHPQAGRARTTASTTSARSLARVRLRRTSLQRRPCLRRARWPRSADNPPAPAGQPDHRLQPAPGRRRDQHGRHAAQAARERARHHRRLHDVAATSPSSTTTCAATSTSSRASTARSPASTNGALDELIERSRERARPQAARRGRHPRGAGHQARDPRGRGGQRRRVSGHAARAPAASSTCRSTRPARCARTPSARRTSGSSSTCSRR